jgi:hypothetical protein
MSDPCFGPWAPDIDSTERLARTRSLRAIVLIFARPYASELLAALRDGETDPAALDRARRLFDRLPSRPRRHALATYAALACPR